MRGDMDDITLSVIVPVYNEEEGLEPCIGHLAGVLEAGGESYEIILVDDGSSDRTPEIAEQMCSRDKRVKLIGLSRNFGHQAAITAGMELCTGNCVVVIDSDMQDPPELIPEMVRIWREGFDVVYGLRKRRLGETALKKLTASVFYRVLGAITEIDIPRDTGDFRLLDRNVCEAMKALPERGRYVRGLVSWVGFRQTALEYVRHERKVGKTKYNLKKMLRLAGNGLLSFSKVPLTAPLGIGAVVSLAALAALIVMLCLPVFYSWAAAVSIVTFFIGIGISCIGIVGCYLGRVLDQAQGRPEYIIARKINI